MKQVPRTTLRPLQVCVQRNVFYRSMVFKLKDLPEQCCIFRKVLVLLFWIKDVEWLSVKTKVYLMMLE